VRVKGFSIKFLAIKKKKKTRARFRIIIVFFLFLVDFLDFISFVRGRKNLGAYHLGKILEHNIES
jgi:hypothetical protein